MDNKQKKLQDAVDLIKSGNAGTTKDGSMVETNLGQKNVIKHKPKNKEEFKIGDKVEVKSTGRVAYIYKFIHKDDSGNHRIMLIDYKEKCHPCYNAFDLNNLEG